MATGVLEGKHIDLKDVYNLLESAETQINSSIKNLIQDNLASTKESWLVQSLVDYYYASRSNSVVSILCSVQDPHDKYLLEKLHDGIRTQEHQLQALQLLLHIVHKQPTYLRMVVTMPVLKVVIKCLKAENNIPVLTTAVTIVTILLPSIPTLVGPYLPDIFEIFNRLAAFSVKKPAGNTPDIFLLHLQISVYGLFHRLYGMFPYNFLAYLRHFYTKKENAIVFEEVIKGMLERVRLHPLLITGTKDHETSNQRWRQMETHDVVVECAKMSLDPIEGTWEELHCPVIASRQLIGQRAATPTEKPTNALSAQQVSTKLASILNAETNTAPEITFWSPSEVIGLSTPPSSQRATPAKPFLESSTGPTSHTVGPQVLIHSGVTPLNTPRETPPITDDHEKVRSRTNSRGPLVTKSLDPKRLSSDFPPIVTTSVPQLTPSSQAQSIPPSPLKTEFTSVPPLGVMPLPILNAARELNFDHDGVEEKTFTSLTRDLTSAKQSDRKAVEATEATESVSKATEQKEHAQDKVAADVDTTAEMPKDSVAKSDTPAVSIDTLSQVIEELDNETEDDEDNDDEVSELTSSSRSSGNSINVTAESVAKFMKSVNRIRFNSLTVTNNMEPVVKKIGPKHRSRSCPQFPKIDSMSEEDEEVSRSSSTTFTEPSQVEVAMQVKAEDKKKSEGEEEQEKLKVISENVSASSSKQEVMVTMTTTKTTTCDIKVTSCPMYPNTVDTKQKGGPENEFVHLLQQVLSPAPVTSCEKCRSLQEGQKTDVMSFFNTFSPPELLDRHIRLGGDIHAKELSKIPIPSSQNVNWTHFGGVPPADEISILRGQLMLLHNQLLYERHKREQHARRNRRLLRKIANTKMLEEQNSTKAVQLEQHERMIRDLRVSLKLLEEENRKLKSSKDSEEYEKLVQLRSCLQENEDLKNVKKEFNMLLVRQREEQDALNKRLMKTEANLFNTQKELGTMQQHATLNVKLKEQVIQLQKELLLMGELQQKSQEKLHSSKVARKAAMEQEQIQIALRAQIKDLKSELARKSSLLEGCQQQLNDIQESLSTKEVAMTEIKLMLERLKTRHEDELQSVEDKCQSILRVNQALETQILQLYMEIEELKFNRTHDAKHKLNRRSTELTLSGASGVTEFRERSGSDPSQKPTSRGPLLRMISSPAQVHPDNKEVQMSFSASMEHTNTGETSEYVVVSEEARDDDLHGLLERHSDQDGSETVSLVSHDSTLYPGQQNMMYTDSEDNRSMSNRSSRLGDSGFC